MESVTGTPAPTGDVWCVVVAAGSGRRYGGAKQFDTIGGARVIDRSVAVASANCDGVVVVVTPAAVGTPDAHVPGADLVVAGGATRSESVRNGLAVVPQSAAVILIHDAARPLATAELYQRVIATVRGGAAAAVPVVPVVDTIRSVNGGVVDRDALRAVQTPQGFDAATIRSAHAGAAEATDDATLVEASGGTVVLVDGEPRNIKITGPQDRAVADALRSFDEGDSTP